MDSIYLKGYINKVKRNFSYRIFLYYLFIFMFFLGLIFLFKVFYSLNIFFIVVVIVLSLFFVSESVKVLKIKKVIDLANEMIDKGLFVYAYYLLEYLEDYYNYKEIAEVKNKIKDLANINEENFYSVNSEQLYDAELDRIIDLINFNIDIYQGLYVQNKIAVENSYKQIKELTADDNKLKEILKEQKEILSLEEYRIRSFEYIKRFFERLKKEQINFMLTFPEVDIFEKNYGKFVDKLLDKTLYTVKYQDSFDRIEKAKSIFYRIFADILKAKTKEEIKEKLKELESI